MSKTVRLDFTKGINVIGDKALLPEGFATVLDNVDLRSGSLRPYKAPQLLNSVSDTTTRAWSYRGRWFYSDEWVDYAGEFMGGIERVYASQEGKFPWKIIGGDTANLGTVKPKTVLAVASTADLVASALTATQDLTGIGRLADGERIYRVSAKTVDGVMPPCAPTSIVISDTAKAGASVILTWGKVPEAISYVIFQGTRAEQLKLDEVNASVLTYTDTGSKTASGDSASQYQQSQSFTYAYTYKRNVNGCWDEGPMSFPSIEKTSESGRLITRDFKNDGFWEQLLVGATEHDTTHLAAKTATAVATGNTTDVALNINTTVYNPTLSQVSFTTSSAHGMSTNDKAKFTSTDPVWSNQTFDVVVIDTTHFAIKNISKPSQITSYRRLSSSLVYTSTSVVSTDDIVYLTWTDSGTVKTGLYKATKVDATHFTVPELVTNSSVVVNWIPLNAYYKSWCLYRNEQGGWFLVDEIDLHKTTYVDAKPFSSLGGVPSSYYTENGITVDYDTPPLGLTCITSHYGMLFGISGHTIRWTPSLVPDAWPEVFSVTLPYQPTALQSYGQGLIVLCQDGIYRLDGNTPTGMSLSRSLAEDGCFAPNSVQSTERGLIYLSKRGLMLFDGNRAECLTDTRVPGRMFTAPSRMGTSFPFWWMPTISTRNYSDLAGEDGVISSAYTYVYDNTVSIDGQIDAIKSFYHNGKYYIFYAGNDYAANTCIMMDMQLPGMPLSTLGLKAIDAHVDEYEQAFLVFDKGTASSSDNLYAFLTAQSNISTFVPTVHNGRGLYQFNASLSNRIPLHVRTGSQSFGQPTERKKFQQIEFHGKGTVLCRVYVDGVYISQGSLTMTENPSKDRRLGLPIGTKGYTLDIEFCGDADIRAVEISLNPMGSPS